MGTMSDDVEKRAIGKMMQIGRAHV